MKNIKMSKISTKSILKKIFKGKAENKVKKKVKKKKAVKSKKNIQIKKLMIQHKDIKKL